MVHTHENKHKHGEINNKSIKLVNMASGSLLKVSTMINEGRYCPEVIQQIDSVEQIKADKNGVVKELLKIYNMQ